MIFGVIERNRDNKVDPEVLKKVAAQNSTAVSEPVLAVKGAFGTFYQPHFKGKFYQTLAPAV
ncbi:hypothetical protein KAH55_09680, partial [bacterium]|nr:hypothetical protein [bacterium]